VVNYLPWIVERPIALIDRIKSVHLQNPIADNSSARANAPCDKLMKAATKLTYNSHSLASTADCCIFAVLGRKTAYAFHQNGPIFGAFLTFGSY
jgi:hypothetical protein